jgi:hypothetical protein
LFAHPEITPNPLRTIENDRWPVVPFENRFVSGHTFRCAANAETFVRFSGCGVESRGLEAASRITNIGDLAEATPDSNRDSSAAH